MESKFLKLSNRVIKFKDNIGGDVYFTKVESAATLQNTFLDEETTYSVSVKDIEIETSNNTFTDAILISFYNEDSHTERTEFVDVIVCNLLGTFVSDWYKN